MSKLNIERLAQVMSEILSDKFGAEVTIQYVPLEAEPQEEAAGATA